jgi:ParE-like toxin of type II ParDE toxin-antitoxin system
MTVRWERAALAGLADAWLSADSQERKRMVAAADEVDQQLSTAPEASGESRCEGRRVMFVPPLGVLFRVAGDTVSVLRVWRIRRRN